MLGSGGAFALLGWAAHRASKDVAFSELRPGPFLVSVVLFAFAWFGLAQAWASLTGGARIEATKVWCRSQVLRYVPGAIWAPAARAASIRGRGVRGALSSVAIESLSLLCTGAAVGGAYLTATGAIRWSPLVLLLVVPPLAAWLVPLTKPVPPRRVLAVVCWHAAAWVAYGAAAAAAQLSVAELPSFGVVAGASLLAWAAGFVVVFAPSGAGVRELAYMALVGAMLPVPVAAAGAITARVGVTVAEIIVLAVVSVPRRATTGSSAESSPHQSND